jgi:hypothetical protein
MKCPIVYEQVSAPVNPDTHNSHGLADETVILGVVADPEPQDPALDINTEGAMTKAYSARPKAAHTLEMERGVMRVSLEKLILLIGQALNTWAQASVTGPKLGRGKVPQNSVDLPPAWSRRASSASASSLPAFASRSIWRSHTAASNSANHRRNSASSSAERAEILFSKASSLLMEQRIPPSLFVG